MAETSTAGPQKINREEQERPTTVHPLQPTCVTAGPESRVVTMPSLPNIRHFEYRIRLRAQEITLEISDTLRGLAEKANLTSAVRRFSKRCERVRAIPLALNDTLTYFYTKSLERTTRTRSLKIKQTFMYYLGFHIVHNRTLTRNLSEEQSKERAHMVAWRSISAEVSTATATIPGIEPRLLKRQPIVYITETTIEDPVVLKSTLEEALKTEKPIAILSISSPSKTESIRAATIEALQEVALKRGMDYQASFAEIPPCMMTPYGSMKIPEEIGRILPKQAEIVNAHLSRAFGELNSFATDLHEIFQRIQASRELTEREKRQFVAQLIITMGMPKEDARSIFATSREVRRSGENYRAVDISYMLDRVSQAAATLYAVSPEAARTFVASIAEITGANPDAVNDFIQALRNIGVIAAMAAGTDSDTSRFKPLLKIWPGLPAKFLGIPNPALETGAFLNHVAERIRDVWWITGLNAGFLTLVEVVMVATRARSCNAALAEGWRWFLFLESLIPLQTLTTTFPGLKKLPLQLSIQSVINFAKKIRILEGFGQGLDEWVPAMLKEGAGIGLGPMEFSREKLVAWLHYVTTGGGSTFVLKKKQSLFTETSGPIKFKVVDLTAPGGWGERSLKIDVRPIKAKSPIPETFIVHTNPLIYMLDLHNNPRVQKLMDFHRRHVAVIEEIWRSGEIGVPTTGSPPFREALIAGAFNLLISIATPLFPKVRVYKGVDTTAVAPINIQGTHEDVEMKPIERRDPIFDSHALGNFTDILSNWLAMNLNFLLISWVPGVRNTLHEVSDLLENLPYISTSIPILDWSMERMVDILSLGFVPFFQQSIDTLVAPNTLAVHGEVMRAVKGIGDAILNGLSHSSGGTSGISVEDSFSGNVETGTTPAPHQFQLEFNAHGGPNSTAQRILDYCHDALQLSSDGNTLYTKEGWRIWKEGRWLRIEGPDGTIYDKPNFYHE